MTGFTTQLRMELTTMLRNGEQLLLTLVIPVLLLLFFTSVKVLPTGPGERIDFLAPGKEGDTLAAEAVEMSASGRTGVYDVTVRDSAGKTVALFRGKSYRISGEVIAGLDAEKA